MPVNDLILIRAGTSAQWSAANPVLQNSEPGYDTTLQRIKFGNGVTAWSGLPWSGPVGISGLNITPASGFFSNVISGVTPNAFLHVYSSTSGSTLFNTEGTNGSLFSVTDNLSGSLMSVNNNAGLPIFEVFSDDRVIAGRFNQNDLVLASGGQIGIGVYNSGTQKLYVVGPTTISGLFTGTSGNFTNSLTVNNTGVSLSGHFHTINDITNFNSGVSGLLPVTNIIGTSGASVTSSGTVFTVAVTGSFGLTTSEIQTLLNSGVSINVVSGTGNFNSLSVTGIPVSVSGHSHTLTIGSGSGIAITYDSSQTLNIVGSGNSEVSYNNSNKTVLISSPTANRGYEVLGSGKSVFTVDNGYVVGNIDVFYNGVKLLNGSDFTATNGTTFALAVSGIAGDVVEWTSFTTSPRYQVIMGEVRSDFVSGVNYIGNALQGSSESDSVWRIKKTTISSDGEILSNLTATNVKWTDRLIETYV